MKNKRYDYKSRIYRMWINMKSRCYCKNASKFYLYGGKGIQVCEEWRFDFERFRDWAYNNGYNDSLTIDRIDSNKNYCPENCRFATYKEQGNNTSQIHNITYNGKTMGIYAWAEYLGISKKMLSERIRRGWDIERALTTPNIKNSYNFGEYIAKLKSEGKL